jgi:CheY-like chemotaxis protein
VLVADDDRVARRIAAAAVESAGGSVVAASDGTEAVRIAAAHSFDAAVLDFRMPGLDGADVCGTLRAIGFRGPVLGLTSEASAAEIEAWHAAGCADVLIKGASRVTIISRLAEALGRHEGV